MPKDARERLRLAAICRIVSTMSGVGKTKTQKLAYFAQEVFGLPLGYDFEMYHYGPYSFDLDDDLVRLRLMRLVEVEPDPSGYGFHVRPASTQALDNPPLELEPEQQTVLDRAIARFGSMDAQKLELRSTIHFVAAIVSAANRQDVIQHVQRLKPKFALAVISDAYEELRVGGLLPA